MKESPQSSDLEVSPGVRKMMEDKAKKQKQSMEGVEELGMESVEEVSPEEMKAEKARRLETLHKNVEEQRAVATAEQDKKMKEIEAYIEKTGKDKAA